ncbi:MAG: S-layer homology domain-containing protein [Bryobacterales bacterium]|nr:S-layer homology domain-containing protein [Bryobacterales bacterium]
MLLLFLVSLLFLLVPVAPAQPVSFSVAGTFAGQPSHQFRTPAGDMTVEFDPTTVVSIDAPRSNLQVVEIAKIRVTKTGNPLISRLTLPDLPFTVTVTHTSGESIRFNGYIRLEPLEFGSALMLAWSQEQVSAIAGVTFGCEPGLRLLAVGIGLGDTAVSLYLSATRMRFILDPPVLSLTVASRTISEHQVRVNLPQGTQLRIGSPYLHATVTGPDTVKLTANHWLNFPLTTSVIVLFSAPGVEPAVLRVNLNLVPNPDFLELSPKEVTFAYTRGSPPPPAQVVSVNSAKPFHLAQFSWDTNWLSPALSGNNLILSPLVTSKPAGTHRTIVSLRNDGGTHSSVYVNFFVNDGPGSVNVARSPSFGGTVQVTPGQGPYLNGSRIRLSATPAPGFVFGRWTGALRDIDSTVELPVNGTVNVTAEFLPASGSCTYSLNPAKIQANQGDDGFVEVHTQAGCPWTVGDPPSWFRLRSPASGIGPAVIYYTVSLQAPQQAQSADIRIASRYLRVDAPNCASVSSLLSASLPTAGGTAALRISTGCFPYVSPQSWLRTPSLLGGFSEPQELLLPVDSNSEPNPRAGSITVATQRMVTIQRAANPVAPFADVDVSHPFADHVAILKLNGAVDSCSPGLFCPDANILRGEMAELLVRSMLRTDDFITPSGPRFSDVPPGHPKYRWIQKLAELGVSNGCAPTLFCPDAPVPREQMAALIVRARAGLLAAPAPVSGHTSAFADVANNNIFAAHIIRIHWWGVTAGCHSNAFCPSDLTTRGQMAAFLVRAFFTPW